jgi:hypothetical protein
MAFLVDQCDGRAMLYIGWEIKKSPPKQECHVCHVGNLSCVRADMVRGGKVSPLADKMDDFQLVE